MPQTSLAQKQKHELPSWLWLWLVPSLLVAQLIIRWISPEFASERFSGESGIVENLTVIVAIPAVLLVVYILMNRQYLPARWMQVWYGFLGLACLYFAGEEASWGQHWFGWQTPEVFKQLNDQGETNFHNMSSWLDQKPRLIVELSALFGGAFLPMWRKYKGIVFETGSWQSLFWPSWVLLPVSLIIGLIKIPDRIFSSQTIPHPFNINVSETQETYVAIAFLIYLLSVSVRLKQK